MRRFFFTLFFAFLFPFSAVFAEDKIVQAVGIVFDRKSPNANVERILKKVILSVSSSNKNVNLFSSESADIEYTGIKELNGTVLVKSIKKGRVYQIELYQLDSKTNRFSTGTELALKDFGDRVDDIALQIVSNIAVQFPPKPLAQLTKIDLIKVKLSEYESQDGYWSLSVIPVYGQMYINVGINDYSSNSYSMEKNVSCNGVGGNVEGTYRIQQWNFMIGAGSSLGWWNEGSFNGSYYDFNASAMAGYGIFGSLIILGIQPSYYLGSFKNNATIRITTNKVAPLPDVTVQEISFNLFIQINITKDYYITFSAGPPIPLDFFNDIYLDFNKNGQYPAFALVKASSLYSFGMPFINIRFNFRLFGSLDLQILYDSGGPNFEGDTVAADNAKKPLPVFSGVGSTFMKHFNFNKTRIGLGIQYEF